MMRPLHRAGLGIMLLSTKSDDEVGRMIRRYNAEADEESVIVSVSEVMDTVRKARSLGYCETSDLATPGAGVIATLLPLPVEGRSLSIGIGGPTSRLRPRVDSFREMLLREVDAFGHLVDPFGELDSAITGRP